MQAARLVMKRLPKSCKPLQGAREELTFPLAKPAAFAGDRTTEHYVYASCANIDSTANAEIGGIEIDF